ncbi:MAG TPA: hypothetical protein VFW21_01425 [Mycobacterium sp.]|nr:hypothetical protein [Mycobacterium sp.]
MSGQRAPSGSRYQDQRRYTVADNLVDLYGPTAGIVALDRTLDWSADPHYDLDDAGDLQLMYQTVLNEAVTRDELRKWLNAALLRRLWPSLWLPGRLRTAWEDRFPKLMRTRLTGV